MGSSGLIDVLRQDIHTKDMSEATEYTGPVEIGSARVFVKLHENLTDILDNFIDKDRVKEIGGIAIRLVSEEKLTVYRHITPRDEGFRQSGISELELENLRAKLKDRQSSIKPTIDRKIVVEPLTPPEGFEDEGSGIDLRFGLVFDDLTRQLLASTTLLDTTDKRLYAHFRLRRPEMRLGPELTRTARTLFELAQGPMPIYVRSFQLEQTSYT